MTINFRAIIQANGRVSAEQAAVAIFGIVGGSHGAEHMDKDERERAFRHAGFTPAIRLNLAETLLKHKEGHATFGAALSVLNRTYGLDDEMEAEADMHHRRFFSLANLKAADRLYRKHGGSGYFIQQLRQLADYGGDEQSKVLVVAVLAHSYAKLMHLDERRFSVAYFEDRQHPDNLGFERNGRVNVNVGSLEWRYLFAGVIGTIAHETRHALHEKEAADFAAGRIVEHHPRYLHAKAAYINRLSYVPSGDSDAAERRYEEQYMETAANLVAARFEHTAALARVAVGEVLTHEHPHRSGAMIVHHRRFAAPSR